MPVHDNTPSPASKPAPGRAAPSSLQPASDDLDGGANGEAKLPIKLNRELLKARAPDKAPLSPPGSAYSSGNVEGASPFARMAAEDAEQKAGLGIKLTDRLDDRRAVHAVPTNGAAGGKGRPMYESFGGAYGDGPAKSEYTTQAARSLAASPGEKGGSSFIEQMKLLGALENTEERLFKDSRDSLIFHVVRFAGVSRMARSYLKPEHYDLPGEKPHQVTLRVLYKLVDSGDFPHGAVPFAALRDAVMNGLSDLPAGGLKDHWVEELLAEPEDHTEAPGLLWRCYHEPEDRLAERAGVSLLKRFVRERSFDAFPRIVESLHGRTPRHFPRELADLQALDRRLASLGAPRASLEASLDADLTSFVSAWGRQMLGVKTGLDPLDRLLGGLQGLCTLGAPAGVGKTALMVQLAVGVARNHDS